MISRRRGRFLVLLVIAWFYGTLLFLYPKSFRLRYSAELRRDFFGLSREALREGGILGVLRVWFGAFSTLVLTALRRRRNTLPMERRIASMVVMPVHVVLIAVIVGMLSYWQAPPYAVATPLEMTREPSEAPTYEAWAGIWMVNIPNSSLDGLTKPDGVGWGTRPPGIPEKLETIRRLTHTHAQAEEVIRRLEMRMKPAELLNNLSVENDVLRHPKEVFVNLTYKDSDPERTERILDMVGKVAYESHPRIGYSNSVVPKIPASSHPSKNAVRNGAITLMVGLLLCPLVKHRELTYVLSRLDRGDTSLIPPLGQIGAR